MRASFLALESVGEGGQAVNEEAAGGPWRPGADVRWIEEGLKQLDTAVLLAREPTQPARPFSLPYISAASDITLAILL